MRILRIAVVMMIVAAFLLTVNQAQAATVMTASEDGTPTETFQMGENVRIIAGSNSVPFNIVVEDPDGIMRHRETVYIFSYDKVLSTITGKPGWWKVRIEEGEIIIRGTQPNAVPPPQASTEYLTAPELNAVPEVPLGTIMIVSAFFAALGIVAFRKRSNHKPFSSK